MAHSRSSSTDSFKSFTSDPASATAPQINGTTPPEPSAPSPSAHSTPAPTSSPSTKAPTPFPPNPSERLPPSEEASLLSTSHTKKATGNAQFASKDFSSAVQTYDKALADLPIYLDYEIAVLNANIAACHIKMAEWREAVESSGRAVEGLERLDPVASVGGKGGEDGKDGKDGARGGGLNGDAGVGAEGGEVEEIDDAAAEAIERLQQSGHTHDEVQKLRVKALIRRAKARTELGSWAELQGAEEDYTQLLRMRELTGMDRKNAEREVGVLRPRLEEAKSREMREMMGKLKGLGDGLLKPFGMSTDMFNFVRDERTGGYSVNFDKGGGGQQ